MPTREEIAQCRREAYETIQRVNARLAGRSPISDEEQIPHRLELPRVEKLGERHRREIEAQEKAFEIERARERVRQERREARTHAAHDEPLLVATNQRVGALETQVRDGFAATGQIAEAIKAELEVLRIENVELKTNLAKLESKLAQIELQATERSKIVDLPALRAVQ